MCKDGFLCGESEKVPLDGRSRVDEAAMGNIGSPHKGHRRITTTEIYAHVEPAHLRRVWDRAHPLGGTGNGRGVVP